MPLDNKQLIEGLLKIRNKRGIQVPLRFNPAQEYYWQRKTRRNLILKARQKGISKVIDADQLIDCIKKSTNAVVISHEKEATKRLFASVRYYIDNLAVKPVVSIDSASELKFPKRGSSYFIGTAGQKAFGRGDTIDRAHLSEAAYYDDIEKILAGVAEATEYGQIDIETTANGRNGFYDLWQKAKQGQSAYTPIFIPWFIDAEYSVDSLTPEEREGLSASVRAMFDVPDDEFIAGINDEEKRLVARVAEEYKILLTAGQLKWRRYKIWDKGVLFWQEYPEDDVSCFLQNGRSVFTIIMTDTSRKVLLDNFEIYGDEIKRKELKKRRLFAGIDCAEGTLSGDSHVFSVIDVPPGDKAHVIYEHVSNEPIDVFWRRIVPIIKGFNMSLGIEKNGVGVAHVLKAREHGVSFQEWETTPANRSIMISELEEAYRKGDLIETYTEAENEARDMIYTSNNRAEAQNGKHDDRIFSRAIAWQMRKQPMPSVEFI